MIFLNYYKFDPLNYAAFFPLSLFNKLLEILIFYQCLVTTCFESGDFKISGEQFSKVNKTRGEHGLPAYIQSLLIGNSSDLRTSTIDGNILFLKRSTIRKNRI